MLFGIHASLEEKIIGLLGAEPSLTAAELRERLATRGHVFSLQGIYKELAKLDSEGIVIKIKMRYSLRLSWVLNYLSFGKQLENLYTGASVQPLVQGVQSKRMSWTFRSLTDVEPFWAQQILYLLKISREREMTAWVPYPWFALVRRNLKPRYRRAVTMTRKRVFVLVGNDGPLSKRCVQDFPPEYPHAFASHIPDKYADRYLHVIDDWVLTVSLARIMTNRLKELFSNRAHGALPASIDVKAIIGGTGRVKLTIERNAKKGAAARRMIRSLARLEG